MDYEKIKGTKLQLWLSDKVGICVELKHEDEDNYLFGEVIETTDNQFAVTTFRNGDSTIPYDDYFTHMRVYSSDAWEVFTIYEYLVTKILEAAQEKGITLTEKQLAIAVTGVTYWLELTLPDSIDTALSDISE